VLCHHFTFSAAFIVASRPGGFRAHNIHLGVSAIDPAAVISCREAQICQVLFNLLQIAFDELVDWEGERWAKLDVTCCPAYLVPTETSAPEGSLLPGGAELQRLVRFPTF
jgi:hypothetical protein